MRLHYEVKDEDLNYPYLIKGNRVDLEVLINYFNTVQIYVGMPEPLILEYSEEDDGIFLCFTEFINLQQNQELLGVELEEE